MGSESQRYIDQIFDLTYKKAELDQILFDIASFGEKIDYRSVMKNKDNLDRKEFIQSQIDTIESSLLKGFLQGLLDKNDFWIFEPGQFKIFMEDFNVACEKTLHFTLTTAIELNEEDIKNLSKNASVRMGKKVLVDFVIDDSIIGGAIIKKDNYILDFSIITKLNTFAEEWKKAIDLSAKESNA